MCWIWPSGPMSINVPLRMIYRKIACNNGMPTLALMLRCNDPDASPLGRWSKLRLAMACALIGGSYFEIAVASKIGGECRSMYVHSRRSGLHHCGLSAWGVPQHVVPPWIWSGCVVPDCG